MRTFLFFIIILALHVPRLILLILLLIRKTKEISKICKKFCGIWKNWNFIVLGNYKRKTGKKRKKTRTALVQEKRTRSRKHDLKQESAQENIKEKKKIFFFLSSVFLGEFFFFLNECVFFWTSACCLSFFL